MVDIKRIIPNQNVIQQYTMYDKTKRNKFCICVLPFKLQYSGKDMQIINKNAKLENWRSIKIRNRI